VDLVNELLKSSSPLSPIISILPSKSMGTWPGIAHVSGYSLAKRTFSNIAKMVEVYVDEHKVKELLKIPNIWIHFMKIVILPEKY